MRYVEVKALADQVQSDSVIYELIAYLEYGFYSVASTMSTISMVYHTYKKFKPDRRVSQEKP
jgi:hypothetical protein